MKGKKRCICGALCVLLAGCLAGMAGMSGRVQASGLTNDLIKEKEAEISDSPL